MIDALPVRRARASVLRTHQINVPRLRRLPVVSKASVGVYRAGYDFPPYRLADGGVQAAELVYSLLLSVWYAPDND